MYSDNLHFLSFGGNMKKFIKSCLCVVVACLCGLIFIGCKDNNNEGNNPTISKKDVSVNVTCEETVTAFGSLPTLSAAATSNGATVSGTITWDDGQTITVDKTTYNWTFTPSDTNTYNIATGSKTLTVNKAVPTAELEVDVDRDGTLNDETLVFSSNGHIAKGTISWATIDLKSVTAGTPIENVEFTFTSTDPNFENVSGVAKITPKYKPTTNKIPNTLDIGTRAEDLATELSKSFMYGTRTKVPGTCTVNAFSLVAGNNILSLTFTPEDTVHYLIINQTFEAVAFRRENNFYLIENAQQLLNLSKDFSTQSFKLANDIDFSSIDLNSLELASGSVPHLVANNGTFRGTLDGNGYKIYGINATNSNARIAIFKDISSSNEPAIDLTETAVVKNLVVEATGEFVLAAYVRGNSMTMFENVTISGSVSEAKNCYAPFVTFVEQTAQVYFKDCTNNYKITGLGTVSAFVGNSRVTGLGGIIFEHCTNNADILGQMVGLFLAEGSGNNRLNGDSNEDSYNINNGNIRSLNKISLWGYGDSSQTNEMFKNNGTFKIEDVTVTANFGSNGLESSNLTNGTSYVKVFAVVSATNNADSSLTTVLFEEMARKDVVGTSVNFENIVQAEAQRRKTSLTEPFLTYATEGDVLKILVNFWAIDGLEEDGENGIPKKSDWRVSGAIELVIICYDANGNIIGVSDNPTLAPAIS